MLLHILVVPYACGSACILVRIGADLRFCQAFVCAWLFIATIVMAAAAWCLVVCATLCVLWYVASVATMSGDLCCSSVVNMP